MLEDNKKGVIVCVCLGVFAILMAILAFALTKHYAKIDEWNNAVAETFDTTVTCVGTEKISESIGILGISKKDITCYRLTSPNYNFDIVVRQDDYLSKIFRENDTYNVTFIRCNDQRCFFVFENGYTLKVPDYNDGLSST